MLGPKIIVTPLGGQASVPINEQLYEAGLCRKRTKPDFIFSEGIDAFNLDAYPDPSASVVFQTVKYDSREQKFVPKGKKYLNIGKEWRERTGLDLDTDMTIRENLLRCFNETPGRILLFGKCSLSETFFTNEGIKALCIVRHPLYSYDSLFGRRHPQWSYPFGGIESKSCVEAYLSKYEAILKDFHLSGSEIVRYESLIDDLRILGYDQLADLLEPMWNPTAECRSISKEIARYLQERAQ